MRARGFLLLTLFLFSNLGFGQSRIFSKQEIIEDLAFLKSQLEEKYPNTGIYNTTEEFNDFFKNISVGDDLSEIEAYSLIASSNEVILDGHTLFYPNQDFINRNNASGFFLPIRTYWDGERLYILEKYSQSKELIPGSEILSINGMKSKDLIQGILSKMMSDGRSLKYPIWVLNTYFFEYYSYFYGCGKEYELGLKQNEKDLLIKIEGVPKTQLLQKIRETRKENGKGISVDIDRAKSTAILTIKDWHKSVLKKQYNQKFIPEIKSIIKQLEKNNIEDLVIDVRNNQGGDTKYSKYLLSHLLKDPFVLVEGYKKKRKGKVVKSRGPQMGVHKPMSTTFQGSVYVLTNGGSFSNTGIFCSVLRKHKRAVFIGEETGGSEFVLCGIPKNVKLPNTGITIELPRLQFLIKSYDKEKLHGVIPDFKVKPSIENLVKGEDPVIDYTFKLIKEKRD